VPLAVGFIHAEIGWNLIKDPACHSLKQVVKQTVNLKCEYLWTQYSITSVFWTEVYNCNCN